MVSYLEVEELAMDLEEVDRVALLATLLDSLPPGSFDDDEEVTEALSRAEELRANPQAGISLEQFDSFIAERRRQCV